MIFILIYDNFLKGMAGFNPRVGRPKLSAWLDRVMKETSPFYEEAHALLGKIANKYETRLKSRM